jgi:hypothetical protein
MPTLQKLAVVWLKNVNFFAKVFGENILKIIISVPGIGFGGIVCLKKYSSSPEKNPPAN